MTEPVWVAGTRGQEERSTDSLGEEGEQEGDHVTRLILALGAGQVGEQLGVGVMAGEQEPLGDGYDGGVGMKCVQLRQNRG